MPVMDQTQQLTSDRAYSAADVSLAPTPSSKSNVIAGRGQTLAAVGGLLGALVASSCCIVPVVLFSLGISGAWIGNLTQLAPYKPYFIIVTLVFIGSGYLMVRRAAHRACAGAQACANPLPNRIVRIALFVATFVVIAAFAFDYVAPFLLA